ncbi:hypothetical protein DFH08DRAFT_963708 [Mycena albidolilacea]|uniref:Uncharacterized protein n=1 Tax=Mycena albidolilacea TaxID=1033008 RepID=A0AAD6ZVN1_9AGAR|nr:hypothetical protein DFH08DRAFT_963708 [Mycena albidolilacea]
MARAATAIDTSCRFCRSSALSSSRLLPPRHTSVPLLPTALITPCPTPSTPLIAGVSCAACRAGTTPEACFLGPRLHCIAVLGASPHHSLAASDHPLPSSASDTFPLVSLTVQYTMGRKGVSGRVKIKTGVQKGMQKTTRVRPHRSAAERAQVEDSYQNQISQMSFLQREELLADTRMSPEYDASFDLGNPDASDSDWADDGMDVNGDGFRTLPPGEEGLLQSHAGGEAVFLKMPMLVGTYLDTKLHGSITTEDDMPGAWRIHTIGFSEFGPRTFAYTTESRNANKTLLKHGYIGGSPDQPTIAFALSTLKIYRQIHCRLRSSNLVDQLSTAYDAYLAILRGVDNRVQAALNQGEHCIDGNNSLKLIDSTFRAGLPRFDNRKSDPFQWLTTAEVDVFKDEVKNSEKVSMASAAALAAVVDSLASDNTSVPATTPPPCADPPLSPTANHAPPLGTSTFANIIEPDEDVAWLNVNELGEDLADELQRCVNTCVECWRNAGPEAQKKMFALFAISGIFLSVCRHGHVLVICDMIRSRELMKYLLAVVQRLLDVYGEDGAIGYDIWCAFVKTLLRSTLKHWVVAFRLSSVIDEHFDFHDLDKHTASGNFIFENYRQATEKIAMSSASLQVLEERLHTTATDYETYLQQECDHLEALRREPPDLAWIVEYMELLEKRNAAEKLSITAMQDHRNLDFHIINSRWTAPKIKDVRTSIEQRWVPTSKEYQEASVMMSERRYRQALDNIEFLVVQRLMEMTKLGASSVAYKLHEKIEKNLKTRMTAIQRAVAEYYLAAAQLDPPRQQLTWAQIVGLSSVAGDIRRLPWADPARREAMMLYFGIQRAKEEIHRLNIEMRRLVTFMVNDHVDYVKAIRAHISPSLADLPLAHELSTQLEYRSNINRNIVERLLKTTQLAGFSGSLLPGEREGREVSDSDLSLPDWAVQTLGLTYVVVDGNDDELGDTVAEDVNEDDLISRVMDELYL